MKHRLYLLSATLAWGVVGAPAIEVSRRADDFVDTVGINVHIDVPASQYQEAVVGQLGVRHLRSNVKPGVMPTLQSRLAALYAKYGARTNVVCDTTSISPVQYRDMVRDPMFASIEGLNEPDADGPRSYAGLTDSWSTLSFPATLAFQRDLFAAMLADPATAGKAVLSPAMANPANSGRLQSVAADFIAMHSYPAQEMPTGNFLASFAIPSALAMNSGPNPMRLIATETGYRIGSQGTDISNPAAAKYVPRIFAEYFRLGVVRTFLFELTDTAGGYNYGLVSSSFAPKPAYHALQNLLGLLRDSTWNSATRTWDRAGEFLPESLALSLAKPAGSVHHLLLQKADGRFYLLLWQEVPSYDVQTRSEIANPTVPVDVTLDPGFSVASVYHLDANTPKQTARDVRTLRVDVPDEVVVVEFNVAPPPPVPVVVDTTPYAAITAVVPKADATANEKAVVAVTRFGDASAPLTINYSTSGSAVSGVDFDPLPGAITLPAGASEARFEVTARNAALVGCKSLGIALEATAEYRVAAARSTTVCFGESRSIVADFERDIAGWSGNAGANTTWTSNSDHGAGALQVDLHVNGTDRWINNFERRFATPQDWSAVNKLVLRFKEDAANPASDAGKPLYFTWRNNGIAVGGGYGAGKVPLTRGSGYRSVTIDLGDHPRDQVTSLFFYVDAATLEPGRHTVYLDNVAAVTDTNGVLDDFEVDGIANWSSAGESSLQLEGATVDTGSRALRWTYTDRGARWGNEIQLSFPLPVDLSAYSTLRFRFKEAEGNPASDVGHLVFVDWRNNGVRANGDFSAGTFPLKPAGSGYRTVEISLAEFKRDNVSAFFFYVDGANHADGQHTWFIDNVTVY